MPGKRLYRGVLALITVLAAVVLPQSAAHAVSYGPYYLMDANSGLCLANPSAGTGNTQMILWNCQNGNEQRWWNDNSPGAGEYWIKNQVSGKCLTIQNARTDNNAPVIQYPCNAGANEVWKYEPYGGGGYISWPDGTTRHYLPFRIKPESNLNMCLTVQNASVSKGAKLLEYSCSSPGSNVWYQVPVNGALTASLSG
jgi:hypothetical protein